MGWHLLGCAYAPLHCFGRSDDLNYQVVAHVYSQFVLALRRSIDSLKEKPLSPWKLMLRDGLNLYAVCPFSYSPYFSSDILSYTGNLARQPD